MPRDQIRLLGRSIFSALIGYSLAILSGCATVRTTIPPSDYNKIHWPTTYTVTTRDGEIRKASNIQKEDSALVIVSPSHVLNDRREYPLRIEFSEIESIETTEKRTVLHVEIGAEAGPNFGAESDDYSDVVGIVELGYLSGELTRPSQPDWGYGGTMMFAFGDAARIGIKARVRHRFHENLYIDFGAGPMLDTPDDGFFAGFVGGIGLTAWSCLSLRSELMTYRVNPWLENTGAEYIGHPGGHEQVWYNGATLTGRPGGVTLGIVGGALLALSILLMIFPPAIY